MGLPHRVCSQPFCHVEPCDIFKVRNVLFCIIIQHMFVYMQRRYMYIKLQLSCILILYSGYQFVNQLRMGASSEDEGELPASLSTQKRRCLKRSRLSSDSEDDKRTSRSSKKRMNSSSKESNDNEGCASEQLNTTPPLQTPRSSERLRRKSSQSFSLPSREKVLDAITPKRKSFSSQQKVKTLKRKLVNNFLRE